MKIDDIVYYVANPNKYHVVKTRILGVESEKQRDGSLEYRYRPYKFAAGTEYEPASQFFNTEKEARAYILERNPLPEITTSDWSVEGVLVNE